MIKKFLRLGVPGWVLDDIESRLTHPYWKRREVPLDTTSRADTIGLGEKREKTSSRTPFKRINELKVLETFKNNGVRRVLDVGCGVGNLVNHLQRKGFDPYGITINPEEVTIANSERICLHDIQASLENSIPFGGGFDAVLSFDCLEHLESPLEALRNINKMIKPGGLFISYIPPSRWIECDYHIIVYSPRQFRWLLNLAGFDLEDQTGSYYFSKKGVTYYARKKYENRMVYPGVLE